MREHPSWTLDTCAAPGSGVAELARLSRLARRAWCALCLRLLFSRPVGDLQRANAARDGRRNVLRVAVPSADCSLGLGIDYACRGDSDELPGKVLNFRITLLIAVGIPSIGSATAGGLSKRPRPGCTITNRVSSAGRPILFSEFCGAFRARSPRQCPKLFWTFQCRSAFIAESLLPIHPERSFPDTNDGAPGGGCRRSQFHVITNRKRRHPDLTSLRPTRRHDFGLLRVERGPPGLLQGG
jgi:hypothetical protein